MSPISKKLKDAAKKSPIAMTASKPVKPFWNGPEEDGITQSMINQYLVCPARFRIPTIVGLKVADRFNKAIEYGNMWHICEENHAANQDYIQPLAAYAQKLHGKYPLDREEVKKWHTVCKLQFPIFVEYWRDNAEVVNRTPLLQEEKFKIAYTLPSGRIVWLRGKFDSVDLIKDGKKSEIYIQENKTKSDVDELNIMRQLTFDLQTTFYPIALQAALSSSEDNSIKEIIGTKHRIAGIRYNVIRRPLSGGKGSIRQHKPSKSNPQGESEAEFYERLRSDYLADDPAYWFKRWTVPMAEQDYATFKRDFMDPILEQICCWYDHQCGKEVSVPSYALHYRCPFGIYNPISDGTGVTDLDAYLSTGSTVGLEKVKTLFPELEDM